MSGRRGWIGWLSMALWSTAVALAAPAAAQAPDLETRYRRGLEALERGDLILAIDALGSVAAENPGFTDVQLLLGQACLAAGLEEDAKEHVERAIAQDPSNGFAAFLLGFTLHRASRFHEAVAALDRAHALAPENPNPLIYRGLAQLELGRPEAAAADLGAALARAPDDAEALTAMARLDLARGEFAAAERRLRSAVASGAAEFDTRLLLARVLYESSRAAEAVPLLEALVAELPSRSDALHLLGQSLLRSGRRDDGQRALSRFARLKASEERIKVLEVEIKGQPADVEARLEIVELYLGSGHPGGALPHLAALRQSAGGDPRVAALASRVQRAMSPQ